MSERVRLRARRVFGIALVAGCLLCVYSSVAAAAGWELTAQTYPTYLAPGGKGTVDINVFNVGAGASSGPITLTDNLPPGVKAVEAGGLGAILDGLEPVITHELWRCVGNGPNEEVKDATEVTCTSTFEYGGGGGAPFSGTKPSPHEEHLYPRVGILVDAGAESSGLVNHVTIAGGGAPTTASTQDPITISAASPPFGFAGWDGWFSNADGTLDTQAGSHPYEATFTFDLADVVNQATKEGQPAGGAVRDVEVQLPPGVIGNPKAISECTQGELADETCPQASEVGITTAYFSGSVAQEVGDRVFNMVPPPGVPSELGFSFEGILTYLDSTVRSGSDYGITTRVDQIAEREIVSDILTLWDVPGESSHNLWRGGSIGGCSAEEIAQVGAGKDYCTEPQNPGTKPFLTLPTSCEGSLPFVIRANTWQNSSVTAEAEFKWHDSNDDATQISGCEELAFGPTITAEPDSTEADTPAGLNVEVKPPLGGLEERSGIGSSDIKGSRVILPEGFVINPGQAAGLEACQESQSGLGSEGASSCPPASKVGTIETVTPLLEGEDTQEKVMKGNIYVLQSEPPDVKLLAAFSADGVNAKLVLNAELNTTTGQITTTVSSGIPQFPNIPQFPVSSFKLTFDGGAQAALYTPTTCGIYTTNADFTPWSTPLDSDFLTTSSFAITGGAAGSPCPSSPLPFAPTLTAGSTNDQAGAYTGFSLLLQNGEDEQRVSSFQVKMPPGLTGMISKVPLCPEPQASLGDCTAASQIGHTVVTSGPGNDPLVIPQPGEPEAPVYLTGPYKGAPFGLSVAVPIIAGPFNLGTEIVRSRIEVDPRTAQITATTDPLPQIIKGVPTDLRTIDAVIDRPEFMLNPTNCSPQQFTGAATGVSGTVAPLTDRFAVGSCRSLEFHPKIQAITAGHASKAGGAGLDLKITYPGGSLGTESWLGAMKLDFPKQLPARQTTLNKACLASVFEANPAGCPPAATIGHATVHTPVLPVPLQGPVYLVSYGAAKFPDTVIVLQGDNVAVDLIGEISIDHKTGITSVTLPSIPGVPFETAEVDTPSGPFSIFAANLPEKDFYNFCGHKLQMPTFFGAQNGLEIHQTTNIFITGCKAKKAKAKAKGHKKRKAKAHKKRK
jgi:hypothetical protein